MKMWKVYNDAANDDKDNVIFLLIYLSFLLIWANNGCFNLLVEGFKIPQMKINAPFIRIA